MSIGSLGGVFGSAAGAPLAQTKGSESERAQRESAAQQRETDTSNQAEKAAGIGQTEEDSGTSERDADGRRMWEQPQQSEGEQGESPIKDSKQSKDLTGNSGNQLDLTG